MPLAAFFIFADGWPCYHGGMAKKPKIVSITVRLHADLLQAIDRDASKEFESRETFIRATLSKRVGVKDRRRPGVIGLFGRGGPRSQVRKKGAA